MKGSIKILTRVIMVTLIAALWCNITGSIDNLYVPEEGNAIVPSVDTISIVSDINDDPDKPELKEWRVANVYTPIASAKSTKSDTESVTKKNTWNATYYGSNEVTGATAEEFNELIDKICDYRGISYSPFMNNGDTLVEIEEEYEVSGIACLAIWTWESSMGTSSVAQRKNNYGGISGSRGYKSFDTIYDGMIAQGRLLRNVYIDKGYIKYSSIGSKYCPSNKSWGSNVASTAKKYAGWLEDIMTE